VTDRELLELAAKAANVKIVAYHDDDEPDYEFRVTEHDPEDGSYVRLWDPLTDDGDALRLAVKLNMQIVITGKSDSLSVGLTDARSTESDWMQAIHIDDPYAATRRAIVRAAAEIAKAQGVV
jgi:hypothetical protein